MNTLKYYMWGFQHFFRISVDTTAKSLFGSLDQKLNPKVFLVGVLDEFMEDRLPICVEPEDCEFQPGLFADTKNLAHELMLRDDERNILHSHPIAQKNHIEKMQLRSIKNAILDVIKKFDSESQRTSFCSYPVKVDGYWVCVVLQVNQEVWDSYFSLTISKVDSRYSVATSLLDAAVDIFLDECAEVLRKPNPGQDLDCIGRDAGEIIRSAGKKLMYTPAWQGKESSGLHHLFDSCNTISSLKYEGAEGAGELIVARKDHPNIKVDLHLKKPIPVDNYKAVRKLMEMTGEGMSLLSDSGFIYGLGKQYGVYDPQNEDLFLIRFTKYYTWHLCHANNEMMEVAYCQPSLPKQPFNEQKLRADLSRIFTNIQEINIEKLVPLINEAINQKHGTMLVITSDAESEANRLANQSTCIFPKDITPEAISLVTSIDGAVLLDPKGKCFAIGVILDGLATPEGDPARGARYNSAIKYANKKNECLIVIVSEDGYIDFLPDLLPQLSKNILLQKIKELEVLVKSDINVKDFNNLMGWFNKHAFYFSGDICDKINNLRRKIEAKMQEVSVKIVYQDLAPNNEMNDSYFVK